MSEETTVQENLLTLSIFTAALAKASSKLLGKSALSVMYLSGLDFGKEHGQMLDCSDDLFKAIDLLKKAELRGWNIERWKDASQENYIVEKPGFRQVAVIFRECPIRQVCLAHDVEMGSALCQLSHGYIAGMLSQVLGKEADITLEHAGPNACKALLKVK